MKCGADSPVMQRVCTLSFAAAATFVLVAPVHAAQEYQGTHLLAEWVGSEAGEEFRHDVELWVAGGLLRIDDTVANGDGPYLHLTLFVAAGEAMSTVFWHEPKVYMACTFDEIIGTAMSPRHGRPEFVSRDERLEAVPLDQRRRIGPWLTRGFLIKEEGPESLISYPSEKEVMVTTVKRGSPLLELWFSDSAGIDVREFAAHMVAALGDYLERRALDDSLFRVLLAIHEDRIDPDVAGSLVELRWPGIGGRFTVRRAEQLPIPAPIFDAPMAGYERQDCR